MARDYYDILGIARGASSEEIKKAYRRLSKELHPDKHKGEKEAERKFQEVNEAYETLSDESKRRMYDQFGEAGVRGAAGGGNGAGFGGFDFSQFRKEDMGGFGDVFESFFGGAGRGRGGAAREERGRDVEAAVDIPLSEVVTGAQRTVQARILSPCPDCGGAGAADGTKTVTCADCGGTGQRTASVQSFFGAMQQTVICERCAGAGKVPETPCPTCQGEGRTLQNRDIVVDIPAGIEEGQTLRVRGQGEAGRRGSSAGDLFVHLRVQPDPRFTRDGAELRSELSVSVPDAALGANVSAETVHGPVSLKIPAGTQPGQTLRIKGKGLPHLHGRGQGDHYVTMRVEIPKKLSRAEQKLMEEWRKLR